MSAGDLIFEKATYAKSAESGKFNSMTHFWDVKEPVVTPDGEFFRIGVAGGSLGKALEESTVGDVHRLTYEGMGSIKSGEWAGQNAHNFTLQEYEDESGSVDNVIAAQKKVESKTDTSLDSIM